MEQRHLRATYNGEEHSIHVFPLGGPCRHTQNDNRNGNRNNSEDFLAGGGLIDQNQKLNLEAEEQEEIELENGNVNLTKLALDRPSRHHADLIDEEASLHPKIVANLLADLPSELAI